MKIKIHNLSKCFDGNQILDGFTAELESGQLVALLGNNGAGKSTLMKLLATLYLPDEGSVYFDGEELARNRLDLRCKLHFLSDQNLFLSDFPVDHVCLAASLYHRSLNTIRSQIIQWFRQFDLLEHCETRISKLSRGQKYKVAFIGMFKKAALRRSFLKRY
ncbi:MAG: ATP-binding cassette domain-containing protein [Planctomycetota bacterium]